MTKLKEDINNKNKSIVKFVISNYKIIIVLILIGICIIIFLRETKVIGTIWGAEHDFAEIDGIKYTRDFRQAETDKYIGKVRCSDNYLLRVYTVKRESDKECLIIEGIEGEPNLYRKGRE